MTTTNTLTHDHRTDALTVSPRDIFLTSKEVIARYRWGRTRGYEMLKRPGFPKRVAGAYRLDTLHAWEDGQLTGSLAVEGAEEPQPAPQLPARRRAGRRQVTR